MKKNILIIGSKSRSAENSDPNNFLLSDGFESCTYEDLVFKINNVNFKIENYLNDKSLGEYDGIFLLTWFKKYNEHSKIIAEFCNINNIKLYNSEALMNRSKGKSSEYAILQKNNLPIIDSIICASEILKSLAEQELKKHNKIIIKASSASRGNHNFLVQSSKELESIGLLPGHRLYQIQKYIKNNGDYRFLVFNGRVKFAFKRIGSGDTHLNNTSKGGDTEVLDIEEIDPKVIKIAEKAASSLNREFTGVDLFIEGDSATVIEVNNMPQIDTGSNVQEKLKAWKEAILE